VTPPAGDADPLGAAVVAAEHRALPDGGRRFRRFAELEAWVREVLDDPWWSDEFPDAPVEVDVLRRSRGATFSAAHVTPAGDSAAIWIRDGSWDAATAAHELAHVACGPTDLGEAHGPAFAAALLAIWRRHLGVQAYGALRSALEENGVPYQRRRGRSAGASP
jgi:putative metallohydrolase (TIGR04338 family)